MTKAVRSARLATQDKWGASTLQAKKVTSKNRTACRLLVCLPTQRGRGADAVGGTDPGRDASVSERRGPARA